MSPAAAAYLELARQNDLIDDSRDPAAADEHHARMDVAWDAMSDAEQREVREHVIAQAERERDARVASLANPAPATSGLLAPFAAFVADRLRAGATPNPPSPAGSSAGPGSPPR